MSRVFDPTRCLLGEGPLWHPLRKELFWFDIPACRLLARGAGQTRRWQFDECVSAAGWVDETTLLVASASELFTFDPGTEARNHIAPLEADNPLTRSNDGRADPFGGFWISTIGLNCEPGAGAIYRYYRGELRRLFAGITIPNAISFDPEGQFALYCDGTEHVIRKVALDPAHGWPRGESGIFIDMRAHEWEPDGAVIDAEGNFWNAQWGAGRVAVYDRRGTLADEVRLPALQATCPALGGEGFSQLFVTSAAKGLTAEQLAARPESGMTFVAASGARGQAEHRVSL